MDPSQLHILTETGIICETQTKIILESRYNNLSAGRQTYQLTLHHENFYQISRLPDKSSNKNKAYARRRKYLVYLNNTLDWIIKPDSIELDHSGIFDTVLRDLYLILVSAIFILVSTVEVSLLALVPDKKYSNSTVSLPPSYFLIIGILSSKKTIRVMLS